MRCTGCGGVGSEGRCIVGIEGLLVAVAADWSIQ